MKKIICISVLLIGIQCSFAYDWEDWDLDKINVNLSSVRFDSQIPQLLVIHYSITNLSQDTVMMRGSEVLDLRSIDHSVKEARRSQQNVLEDFEYSHPERLKMKYGKTLDQCKRVDFTIKPNDSIRSSICFEVPAYVKDDLKHSTQKKYYLVLSSRPANSCPFCKMTELKLSPDSKSTTSSTNSKDSTEAAVVDDKSTKKISSSCNGKALCIEAKVTKIIDGDSINIKNYKIRLSLVNTPEKNQPGFNEAKSFTNNICPVGSLAIIDQDDKQPYDKYKRMVAKVTCSGKVLNSKLLEGGYAVILKKYCTKSEFSSESWAKKFGC